MGKTIVEKLQLQKYKKVAVLHLPEGADYFPNLGEYETELTPSHSYDLIFAFVFDLESLKGLIHQIIEGNHLNASGYIYLAYPKKGNKKYSTFIHRDDILPGLGAEENGYVGTSTIKFARMVGLDNVFTVVGLKEEPQRKNTQSNKASQCVDDYIDLIPSIEKDLQDTPAALDFYQSLTQGYRKDWARYVYSAKQEGTKAKRREEMKVILGAGYKSRDLYKRDH